jgi:DNA-directed RNA polymerase specialized sigma24 family protein
MFGRKKRNAPRYATEYATADDFQQIFSEDMAGLHLLAWLLTADEQKAEQVFVAGLEDSINGNPVFRQWARSWSQRAIIKRAIRVVAPSPSEHAPVVQLSHLQGSPQLSNSHVSNPMTGSAELNALLATMAKLSPFQRFVFVLSVLEGYSTSECAMLLSCTLTDVISARTAALQHIGAHREAAMAEAAAATAASCWKMLFASARAS